MKPVSVGLEATAVTPTEAATAASKSANGIRLWTMGPLAMFPSVASSQSAH